MADKLCPRHGPYSASLLACPYCERSSGQTRLPPDPAPLDDDLTWGRRGQAGARKADADEEATQWRSSRGGAAKSERDDEMTQFPGRRRLGRDEESPEERTEVLRQPKGMLGWLIVANGFRRGQVHPIRDGSTIGKSKANATVVIADDAISALHAKVTVEQSQFVLWDFGSTNGTFVNGRRIREATKVAENDQIQLGKTRLVLKTLAEETPEP